MKAWLLGLVLVSTSLSSCTPSGADDFRLRVGTLNAETLGTTLTFLFDLGEFSAEQNIEVTVRGPAAWNGGAEAALVLEDVTPAYGTRVVPVAASAPVIGRYTAEVELGAKTYRASARLTSVQPTDKVKSLRLGSTFPTVSFEMLAEPVSYYAFLYQGDEWVGTGAGWASGFGLTMKEAPQAGTRYQLQLLAVRAPLVVPLGEEGQALPEQIDASLTTTTFVYSEVPSQPSLSLEQLF